MPKPPAAALLHCHKGPSLYKRLHSTPCMYFKMIRCVDKTSIQRISGICTTGGCTGTNFFEEPSCLDQGDTGSSPVRWHCGTVDGLTHNATSSRVPDTDGDQRFCSSEGSQRG